jgi:SAM-dependent methyltransferase
MTQPQDVLGFSRDRDDRQVRGGARVGKSLCLFTGSVGLFLVVWLGWRFASRRKTLPCPTWLAKLVELDNPLFRVDSARAIVGHLDLRPGMRALDFGCGPGRLTIPIAERVGGAGSVVAVDIQEGMLDRVRQKVRAARLTNVSLRLTKAADAELGRGEYDRAILVTVLGEIPDRQAALTEVSDALKPGGILSVTEVLVDPHFQTRGAVRRLAAVAGLREVAFFGNRLGFTLNFEKPGGPCLERG